MEKIHIRPVQRGERAVSINRFCDFEYVIGLSVVSVFMSGSEVVLRYCVCDLD